MGLLDEITKTLGLSKSTEVEKIEEFMDSAEMENVDVLHEAADFYVKPFSLESEQDINVVLDELKQKNILILNIANLKRNEAKQKMIIDNLKNHITKINGDIARLDENRILVTPSKVKIVKTKKK
ncbi:MAG: cell division protein SepF [Candidatus Micrarchaeota archaeon]|nr:cell division protein SepF [Candidatus Micrarchaeota archaeon]